MQKDELPIEEKLKISTNFLLDSPPGEVSFVYDDIRVLMADDENFTKGIMNALEQYNTEQYITVTLPDQEMPVIVSKYGQIENDKFFDPKSKKIFKLDHLNQVRLNIYYILTEVESHEFDEAAEPLRLEIETAATNYVKDHYPNGVLTVYSKDNTVVITLIYMLLIYFFLKHRNGRWQSTWIISPESNELKGTVKVNVHYYEDGNVQLNATKDFELSTSTNSDDLNAKAEAYIKLICKAENEYQTSLNESYVELSENTFKGLRRALPLTRHKLDWDKILNYKIGQELQEHANKSYGQEPQKDENQS
ncbi:13058_t:CDS:2 [Entrophospora sp. SA101]|nr:13058_t:CDS:2 [Entrophospora sp. SA101]CAJ0835876.1 3666_t:CDS:2 [Entrophospora sp. SA101]